jgi:hypothetical protein
MAEDFNLEAPNQERDLNNNGIPDIHEPAMQPHDGNGYQHQESYEVGRDNTSGAPIVRHQREAMGHLAAAYSTSNPGGADSARRDRVNAQNAAASAQERAFGSDPDTAISRPNYEQTLHDIDVDRKRNAANKKKSSLPAELAATRPHKEDKAHGAEILTELFKGLKAGHKHATQVLREQEHERNQFEAEAMKLRRANDQDLIDHELALKAVERKAAEQGSDAPQNPGSEGTTKAAGESGPGGGDGGPGGDAPGGGPTGGPSPGTSGPETATAEQPAPTPANDVDPAQAPAPGRTAASADVGRERTPGENQSQPEVAAATLEKDPAKDVKPAVRSVDTAPAKEPVGAEGMGASGMGAVMATVNPAVGIAATAVQTQSAQKAAGNDHASEKRDGAKKPGAPSLPSRPQVRTRAKVTFAPGQATRRLAEPKLPETGQRDKVVSIPLKPVRQGGLHAQAAGLSRPNMPVVSRGGPAPTAMPRALGVGLGSTLSAMMKPVVVQNEGPSLVEQMHAERRSGNGASR